MKFFCFLSLALLGAGSACAATTFFKETLLVRYDATPGDEFAAGMVVNGLGAGFLLPGTSAADLEAGATLPGTVFLRPTVASPTANEAITNDQFFEFTISSPEGLLFQPLSLSFLAASGGASAPRGWSILSSADGFTTPVFSSDVSSTQPDMGSFTVSLANLALSADDVTFRIYVYSPGEGEGIFFDDIEIEGLIESLLAPAFRPELLLGAASSIVHGGRTFHREIERQSFGRTITGGDCFHAWGSTGYDWFGGGAGETSLASGGLAFKLPYGLGGQAVGSLESVRGAPIDTDTVRLGFAVDNATATGFQWLAYLGGFASNLESSRSGDFMIGSSLMHLDTSGYGFQAATAAGWSMKHGNVNWGPTASLEYVFMDVESAAFAGAPVRAGVDLDELDSLRTLIGVRASHDPLAFGLQPFASLHLATEWSAADGGVLGTALGTRAVQDQNGRGTSCLLNAGVAVPLWQSAFASISYLGEMPVSGNGTESHGVRLGLDYAF